MDAVSYLERMLDPTRRNEVLQQYKNVVQGYVLVGTGTSGVCFAMALSCAYGNEVCVVRKKGVYTHSGHLVENHPRNRGWLFVDDLVDSGNTFNYVFSTLGAAWSFKGAILYEEYDNRGGFYTPSQFVAFIGYDSYASYKRLMCPVKQE